MCVCMYLICMYVFMYVCMHVNTNVCTRRSALRAVVHRPVRALTEVNHSDV